MRFPLPGKMEGISSTSKPVATVTDLNLDAFVQVGLNTAGGMRLPADRYARALAVWQSGGRANYARGLDFGSKASNELAMGRHAATRMGLTMGGFGFAEGTGDTMLGSPNTQGEGGMSVLGDDNATTGGATANNAAEGEAEEARKRRKEEQEKAEAERLKELKAGAA